MKVKQYNEMMAYLTRPGFNSGGPVNFNGGGSVKKKPVLPKRKPAEEVKRRQKINYEKIKQYLGEESQEFIERELGFKFGGKVKKTNLPKGVTWNEARGNYRVIGKRGGKEIQMQFGSRDYETANKALEAATKEAEKFFETPRDFGQQSQTKLNKKNLKSFITEYQKQNKKLPTKTIVRKQLKTSDNAIDKVLSDNPEIKLDFAGRDPSKLKNIKDAAKKRSNKPKIDFWTKNQPIDKTTGKVYDLNTYLNLPKTTRQKIDKITLGIYEPPVGSGKYTYQLTPFGADQKNRTLHFMYRAADHQARKNVENPTYEVVRKQGKVVGIKDNRLNQIYGPSTKDTISRGYTPIAQHPDDPKVQQFISASKSEISTSPKVLESYFIKYGKTPSYAQIYNYLNNVPGSKKIFTDNPLHFHHQALVEFEPSKYGQLLLADKNMYVEKQYRSYKAGNISLEEFDSNLKKIKTRFRVPETGKFVGSLARDVPNLTQQIATAKRDIVSQFKKRLAENPNIADDLVKAVNALPKYKKIKICNSLAEGGLPGDCAKAIEKDPIKTSNTVIEETKNLPKAVGGKALQAARFIKNIAGPLAIAGEVAIEGGFIADKALKTGMPIKQAFGESILNLALGPKLRVDVEAEREKEFAKGEDFAMAERGRRKAPFLAQGEYADRLRREARIAEMQQKFPGVSEDALKQELLKQDPNIDLSLFPMQDFKQLIDNQIKTEYFADNFRQEKAGGGIMKMAGKSSGPPPTSGPTPDGPSEGLAFFKKNGIKR
jgi:hypothetical protein|tara:strand:- start:369 stop:2678 length:2310 start_codon:yes stop_codon:yes gene_type:complete